MSDEKNTPVTVVESFRALDDAPAMKSQRPLENKPVETKPVYVGPITAVTPAPTKDGTKDSAKDKDS